MVRACALLLTVLGVVAASESAHGDAGDFWCDAEFDWTDVSRIEVFVHPDLPAHMWHSDDTSWSAAELVQEVRYVLEVMMDQAPTGMPPLYYAGFEAPGTPLGSPAPKDTIVIRPLVPPPCSDRAWPRTANAGVVVEFASSIFCPHRRDHWVYADTGGTAFGGVLMHELYHSLGFNHWGECQEVSPPCYDNPGEPQICSLMLAHGLSSEYFEMEYADWHGLNSKYGGWTYDGKLRRQSQNADSWSTLGATSFLATTFLGSDWSSGSTLLPVAVHDTNMNPHLYRWDRPSNTFVDWGAPYSWGSQLGQIDSSASFGRWFMLFMHGQTQNWTAKLLRYSHHTSSTNSTTVYPTIYASRHGHSGSWDVRTERLVHVWRNKYNEIVLATSSGTSTPVSPIVLTGTQYQAAYTPSVSCGPSEIYYNCIMVWASAAALGSNEHFRTLRWKQFRVVGSGGAYTFSFATTYGNGYIQYGPPSVTYHSSTALTHAFVVAFKNPGRCYYTLRKGPASGEAFAMERSHCAPVGAQNGPPMMGSASGWAQAWAYFNAAN
jgi:hypothetical protein